MALLSAFNPHEFSEATVRTVATGREDDLDEILATIRSNIPAGTIQHLIVSAPRGYGKSFMMRHVEIEVARIARDEHLPLAAVLMPEEMPHVKEPETLIRELTRALLGGAGSNAELSWHEDDGEAWATAVDALDAAIEQTVGPGGLLVALVENFDLMLRRSFPKEVQASRLRVLLTRSNSRLMLVAASASGAFDRDYDHRLFQAFKEVALQPWSVDDCLAFFDRQRKDGGKPPLDDLVKARARSVASFIGGTPRLATLLGDALFDEDVLHAADLLQKLVDELTPYYKERIEALPGRSQKLLDALLRGGEPATQSELARRVKAMSQAAIAAPFKDLVREKIVTSEKAQGSAEILYRVADRVFAHFYRRRIIDHGQAACPLVSLVDLLVEYFSPEEKQRKAAEFAERGRIEEARLMAQLHDNDRGKSKDTRFPICYFLARHYIPMRFMPLASSKAREQLAAIAQSIEDRKFDEACTKARSFAKTARDDRDHVLLLIVESKLDAYEGIEGGLRAAIKACDIVESVDDQQLHMEAQLGRIWSLIVIDRYEEALELLPSIAEKAQLSDLFIHQATALRSISFCLRSLHRYEEALQAAESAVLIADKAGSRYDLLAAMRIVAFNYTTLGRHEEAVEAAHRAVEIAYELGDKCEESLCRITQARSLGYLGRYDAALIAAMQAADRASEIGDFCEQLISLRIAASSLSRLRRHEEAVVVARQSVDLAQSIGDIQNEVDSLNCFARCLIETDDYADAAEQVERSFVLANKIGSFVDEIEALRLLVRTRSQMGEYGAAIEATAKAAKILDEHPDAKNFFTSTVRDGALFVASELTATDAPLDELHQLLRAICDQLDFEGTRRMCLEVWLRSLTTEALHFVSNADRLNSWATAIELYFPDRFDMETQRLRAAASYHASGHDAATLARFDPDLSQTLQIMFPPKKRATPPKKRSRKAVSKDKR